MSEITAEMIERGRGGDPRAAAERRRRGAQIRNVRERLTTVDAPAACDLDLMFIYARMREEMALSALCMALLAGFFSCAWLPPSIAAGWTMFALVSLLLCLGFAHRLRASRTPFVSTQGKFVLAEFVHGLAWASLAALLLHAHDLGATLFVVGMLLHVAAFNGMICATAPAAAAAAAAPIALASLLFLSKGVGGASLALVYMILAAQLFVYLLTRRLHGLASEGLVFRAEKSALVAELEQVRANSDEARRRAEEANLAKSRFLATMSHELRTPLNAILGFSEVLKSELFGPHAQPAYKEYSQDIYSSGEHLMKLINEILDLSRVEAGRYELREESVSLVGVAQECRHLLAIRAQKRDIRIVEAMETNLPRLWVDERAVRQIVLNLLTNAVKFTPQGGRVTIKVGWTELGGQYVAIQDTGPGIPEEEIAVVMSSFGRGALAQKNADEGSGLGLPIVKGLVELHGGMFTLRSKIREGTEAVVVFPPSRVMSALPKIRQQPAAAA